MEPPFLAVDPGETRIGLAVSDPTGTVARPLTVIEHVSRTRDAERIAEAAAQAAAQGILVGVALDADGRQGAQARRALRLVEALRSVSGIPVATWDESFSTQTAGLQGGTAALDARAAAVILQDFLDHGQDQP
jgi:putative Holliday junction resolvase